MAHLPMDHSARKGTSSARQSGKAHLIGLALESGFPGADLGAVGAGEGLAGSTPFPKQEWVLNGCILGMGPLGRSRQVGTENSACGTVSCGLAYLLHLQLEGKGSVGLLGVSAAVQGDQMQSDHIFSFSRTYLLCPGKIFTLDQMS